MKVLSLVLRQLHFPDPMPGRMLEQGFLRSHHSMRSYAAYAAVGHPPAPLSSVKICSQLPLHQ